MTQGKTHPPTEPFTPDPTRENSHHHRDPASDLPTDPIRHGTAEQRAKKGGGSHDQHSSGGNLGHPNSSRKESGSSSRGGTSEQHAKAGSQSHKNK